MGLAVEIISKVKSKMRERGVRYKDLATYLEISESTLKRSFSKNLFTLDRIEQICEFLELPLKELAQNNIDQIWNENYSIITFQTWEEVKDCFEEL